jgi:hypothetical protein
LAKLIHLGRTAKVFEKHCPSSLVSSAVDVINDRCPMRQGQQRHWRHVRVEVEQMGVRSSGPFVVNVPMQPVLRLVNSTLMEESEKEDTDDVSGVPEGAQGFGRKTLPPQEKRTEE